MRMAMRVTGLLAFSNSACAESVRACWQQEFQKYEGHFSTASRSTA